MVDNSAPLVKLRMLISNARLADARKKQGLTQNALAVKSGVTLHRLSGIETLRIKPTEAEELHISVALGIISEELFPLAIKNAIDEGVFSERVKHLKEEIVIALTEARREALIWDGGIDQIEERVDRENLEELIPDILSTLKPREEMVIRLRFGLGKEGSGKSKTLEDVGAVLKFGGERARQVEAKALRKLRHPARSRKLDPFL